MSRHSRARRPARWKEPPVFFFDRRRQAELEAAQRTPPADPFADLAAAIVAELPDLFASVEVRRVARAIDGLRSAAEILAPVCPAATDLADLLAIPDDEVFLVLHPERRAGFRLVARGVADVGQFHILLADAVTGDPAAGFLPGPPLPTRFVAACRDVNPATPAGVPMVAEARYQLYTTGRAPDRRHDARRDLAVANTGSGPRCRWHRSRESTASASSFLAAPAFAMTWDVSRRFPALAGELRLLEALSPFRVAERLERLTGRALPRVTPRRRTLESGLKPDRHGAHTNSHARARDAIERPRQPRPRSRPSPGNRSGRPRRSRRTPYTGPRSTTGNSAGRVHASAPSSARSSTDASRRARRGAVPSPTTRRIVAAISPLTTSSRTGFVSGGNEHATRAEIEKRRGPRGPLGVRQLHIRDRDDRRLRREPVNVRDQLKRRGFVLRRFELHEQHRRLPPRE